MLFPYGEWQVLSMSTTTISYSLHIKQQNKFIVISTPMSLLKETEQKK